MSALFGNKNIKDIFFGNKAVTAIYRGSTLVWQRIKKIIENVTWSSGNCIEFIPSTDMTLTSVSILVQDWNTDTNHKLRILNECGICIAYSESNGVELHKEIYTYTGSLHTVTSLGTITLYANQKYYLCYRSSNNGENIAYYKDLTHNFKNFDNIANINSVYSVDAYSHKCDGEASSFAEICQKNYGSNGCYFVWRGEALPNGMVPGESGSGNPYPYLLKRDMSKVKKVFTDTDFNNLSDDMERYAYIYYTMGNTEGDEFIMNSSNWQNGFEIVSGESKIMQYNYHKIFKLTGNIVYNHITSMTPLDNEPQNPDTFSIYYKSAANTWGTISGKAVVAWTGSSWEIARQWQSEWSAISDYDATNYCEKINDSYAKDFNKISVSNGTKFYYKVNDTEV